MPFRRAPKLRYSPTGQIIYHKKGRKSTGPESGKRGGKPEGREREDRGKRKGKPVIIFICLFFLDKKGPSRYDGLQRGDAPLGK